MKDIILDTQYSLSESIKGVFKIKRKISVEQACQEFYNSVIFYKSGLDSKEGSGLWEKTLEFVTKSDPLLANVEPGLFQREMSSLWMELFGLALKDSLSERDMSHDKSLPYLKSEIMFTKNYLGENECLEIWYNMREYNQTISSSRLYTIDGKQQAWGNAIKNVCDRYANKLVETGLDREYATHLCNRFCGHLSQSCLDNLTSTLALRLGWDIKTQSEPFLQLNTVVLWLYSSAKDTLDSVNLILKDEKHVRKFQLRLGTFPLLDAVRHITIVVTTGEIVYHIWTLNLVLAILAVLPVYILILNLIGFLTWPLYFLAALEVHLRVQQRDNEG